MPARKTAARPSSSVWKSSGFLNRVSPVRLGAGAFSLKIASIVLLLLLVTTSPASAATNVQQGPLRKFSRGVANSLSGLLEIPLTISRVGEHEGPVAALTWGLFTGCGAALTRTAVGLAELITFPIPLSTVGYDPLLQPEFLLQPESPPSNP